jgi:chitinase
MCQGAAPETTTSGPVTSGTNTTGEQTTASPETTAAPAPGAYQCGVGGSPCDDKVVFGYTTNWAMYGRNFEAYQLPMDKLTHMLYAFWNIDENSCEIVSVDEFADFERTIPAGSNTCVNNQKWTDDNSASGTIHAYTTMREQAPHMKLLLSVGGWSMSSTFSKCSKNAADRAKIIKSVKDFLVKYDFDGIDYDWEYPGANRTDGDGIPKFASKWYYDVEHDKDSYIALLKETRAMLTELGAEKSKYYLQTIAIGMGPDKIDYLAPMYQDNETMATSLDFINMMTYDFHGGWGEVPLGHNAPLHPPTNNNPDNVGMSVQESVEKMMDLVGADYHKKLVMGLPSYGRSIEVPAGTDIESALSTAKTLPLKASTTVKSWENGVVSYWQQEWYESQAGWEKKFDSEANQHYLWNADENVFMSYDTPEDIKAKVEWLNSKNLGGAMFWEMDDDPMIWPKAVTGHSAGSARQGEKIFDAALETLTSCKVPNRSRRLSDIFV